MQPTRTATTRRRDLPVVAFGFRDSSSSFVSERSLITDTYAAQAARPTIMLTIDGATEMIGTSSQSAVANAIAKAGVILPGHQFFARTISAAGGVFAPDGARVLASRRPCIR